MAAENLQLELMALAGVAEAEVDESADSPSGVRVRLEPDADARLVGAEVQRVLAAHGLRSRITDQQASAAPQEPAAAAEPAEADAPVEPIGAVAPIPDLPPPLTPPPLPEAIASVDPEPVPIVEAVPEPEPEREPEPVPIATSPEAGLLSISVEESAEGLTVAATATDGRTVTQHGPATDEGLYEAVVSAVGTLAQGSPPVLVSVTPLGANGSQAITVIVEGADGAKAAGAAVVKVSRGYAVGRATWSAFRGA